jgi:hypothetical protein
VKRATPRNADGSKKPSTGRTDNSNEQRSYDGNSSAMPSSSMSNGMESSMYMQGGFPNPMAAMMMGGGGNPMFPNQQQQQSSFDPQMMAQFFQQQNWGNANFNPMAFQQMMMGGGMAGMGGMGGMGGWGGMNRMNMGGSMSPIGTTGAVGNGSPAPSTAGNVNREGMRSSAGPQDRGSATTANRGRSNFQAPPSAGLPTRPNAAQDGKSPNTGRDYSREKSPDRGGSYQSRGGGNGGYNRDGRW